MESAVKQKLRRAKKRAKKLLSVGGAEIFELRHADYHLIVLRPGYPPPLPQIIKICLPGDPDPPKLKYCILQRWEINQNQGFILKDIN